jgi:excinuclease UvrABC nuclease subunit
MENARLKWRAVCGGHGKNVNIPTHSGIYAYAEVERHCGLVVSTRWMYIGQSRNLKQRISQGHDSRYERNEELRVWLKRNYENVELWFAHVNEEQLDEVERQLVGRIKPLFNKKLKHALSN